MRCVGGKHGETRGKEMNFSSFSLRPSGVCLAFKVGLGVFQRSQTTLIGPGSFGTTLSATVVEKGSPSFFFGSGRVTFGVEPERIWNDCTSMCILSGWIGAEKILGDGAAKRAG